MLNRYEATVTIKKQIIETICQHRSQADRQISNPDLLPVKRKKDLFQTSMEQEDHSNNISIQTTLDHFLQISMADINEFITDLGYLQTCEILTPLLHLKMYCKRRANTVI